LNNFVRSPLRHIPGPWLAKLSKAWIFAIELAGQRTFYVHSLHQHYGPVVRVGPNEVSFSSAAALRDIYIGVDVDASLANAGGGGGRGGVAGSARTHQQQQEPKPLKNVRNEGKLTKTFPKGELYDLMRPTVGTMRDEAGHRERRRLVGHCFSASLMPGLEPVILAETALLLQGLEERRGEVVDMLHWFRGLAMDVTGEIEPFFFAVHALTQSAHAIKVLHFCLNAAFRFSCCSFNVVEFGLAQYRVPNEGIGEEGQVKTVGT
jgi:hypothetical protein